MSSWVQAFGTRLPHGRRKFWEDEWIQEVWVYTFSFLLSVTKSGYTSGQTLRPPHFMAEKNIPLFSYQKKEVETSMEMLLEVQSPGKGENNRAIKGRPRPSSLSLSQEPFPLDWDPFKLCMMAWNRDWDFAKESFQRLPKKKRRNAEYMGARGAYKDTYNAAAQRDLLVAG